MASARFAAQQDDAVGFEPGPGCRRIQPQRLRIEPVLVLLEATERFDQSAVARKWFGDDFVDHFVASRRWEVRQYNAAVTDWERKRYLEVI